MRCRITMTIAAAVLLIAANTSLSAHHSFAAEYDNNKPVALTGAVTAVSWRNPHVHFSIDVKDAAGAVTNWEFELGGPNGLLRRGWTRTSLKPGDTVTVNGYLARDGSHLVNAVTVMLSDGRKVFADSSAEIAPTP
jgi:hypothetical protein